MDRVLKAHEHLTERGKTSVAYAMEALPELDIPKQDQSKCQTPVPETTEFIYIMFYEPTKSDHWINRLVLYSTRQSFYTRDGSVDYVGFAHVEICFKRDPDGRVFDDEQTMGFSIAQNTCVYMRQKRWRNEYRALRLRVPSSVYRSLYMYCSDISTQNIKFDAIGMYGSQLMPLVFLRMRTRESHGTYCSKIVAEVLSKFKIGSQVLWDLEPCTSTPTSLFYAIDCAVPCVKPK